jgi:hypothetical protein
VSNPIAAVGTVGKGILRFTTIGSRVVTLLITGGPIDGTRAGPSTAQGPIIGGAIGYLGDCIASGIPSRFMSTPVTAQFGLPSPVVSMVIVAVGSIGGPTTGPIGGLATETIGGPPTGTIMDDGGIGGPTIGGAIGYLGDCKPMDICGPIIGGAIGYLGDCIASGIPSRFMSIPLTAQFGLPSPVVSKPKVALGTIVRCT